MVYKFSKIIFFCELICVLVIFSFTNINSSFAKIEGSKPQKELTQAKEKNTKPLEEDEEEDEDEDC
jgi:zona occludens toxin (predicted ATPase)